MNLNTALEILDRYREFPKKRKEQIVLLRDVVGYEGLKGGGKFPLPEDKQVRAVAHRVMEKAGKVVRAEVKYARDEMAREEYWSSMYNRFNIQEEEREEYGSSPAELEEMLLE